MYLKKKLGKVGSKAQEPLKRKYRVAGWQAALFCIAAAFSITFALVQYCGSATAAYMSVETFVKTGKFERNTGFFVELESVQRQVSINKIE